MTFCIGVRRFIVILSLAMNATTCNSAFHLRLATWSAQQRRQCPQRRRQRLVKAWMVTESPLPELDVILLQHVHELGRSTATAPLVVSLFENQYLHLRIQNLTWSGRADNDEIVQKLQRIHQDRGGLVLMWTGGDSILPTVVKTHQNDTLESQSPTCFLILDGTWQEAQTMFRKIDYLRQLPRWSISSAQSSSYTLRKAYSGWKGRFQNKGETLLCTAEVVAALLEQMGDYEGGRIIRQELEHFQEHYGKTASIQR